jgi:hypothetical protein
MHIHVAFDDEELRSRPADRSLTFDINWEHDGAAYPGHPWSDFGAVIMGWWLRVAAELLEGSDYDEFFFMDGPLSILAEVDRAAGTVQLTPRNTSIVWIVSLRELAEALMQTANTIGHKLASLGIRENDQRSMQFGVQRLQKLLT